MRGRDRGSAGTEGASRREGLIVAVKLSGLRTLYLGTSGKFLGHRRGKAR